MYPCKMISYYCIFIGASAFISASSAIQPSHQAVSSLSYNRGDVPLSYKYNVAHEYTTIKPHEPHNHNSYDNDHNIQPQQPQIPHYQNLQYAPLSIKPEDQDSNQHSQQEPNKSGLYTEANTFAYINDNRQEGITQQEQEQKKHIEPILYYRKHMPGYNVNLEAVNNKLLQTGLYTRNPNLLVKNKKVNINYLRPQLTYLMQNFHNGGPAKEGNPNEYLVLAYQGNQNINGYNGINLPGKETSDMRSAIYVKAPTVLNLAQARSVAHATHKASVKVHSNFMKIPSQPQEFFSNIHPSKTILSPVQNGNVQRLHHPG